MNSKLKLLVNHYEGNLSKVDYQVQFLIKRGKSYARRKLFNEISPEYSYIRTYNHLYHKVKGLSRLLVRTRKFGYYTSHYKQEYIIERNNVKELFFNMILLKDGGAIDLEEDMIISTKSFYRFKKKYEMGFIDVFGNPTDKFRKVTRSRISKEDMYVYFKDFKNEFLYYSECEDSCVRKFIDNLLDNISNFGFDRIGKIYVDVDDERIYLHKEGYINISHSFYDVYDEIEYILTKLKENPNIEYKINISKNR